MKLNRRTSPVSTKTPSYTARWGAMGDMHYAFELCADGHNVDGLMSVFPDQACPAPHWGYVIEGRVRVEYTDGTEEDFEAGDAFYIKAGHRPYPQGGVEIIRITPMAAHQEIIDTMVKAGVLDPQ
jgi:hypothetical protein